MFHRNSRLDRQQTAQDNKLGTLSHIVARKPSKKNEEPVNIVVYLKAWKICVFSGQESELCHMIIDCCAQQRTYEKYFGLIGQRLCQVAYRHGLCTFCYTGVFFSPLPTHLVRPAFM